MAGHDDDLSLLDMMLAEEGNQQIDVPIGKASEEGEVRPEKKAAPVSEEPPKPVALPTVAGMKPGTRFEMRSGRPEVDGIWTVVQVEASEASASKRFLYASRAPDAAPPYAMLTEIALIDALHREQIVIIEHGDPPPMGGARIESAAPPALDAVPKSAEWADVLRALRMMPMASVYKDDASFANDVQRRLRNSLDGARVFGAGYLIGREVPVFGTVTPDLVVDLPDGDSMAIQLRLHRDGDPMVQIRDAIGKAFLCRARYRYSTVFMYSNAYAHPPKLTLNDDRFAEAILEPSGVYLVLRDPGFRE